MTGRSCIPLLILLVSCGGRATDEDGFGGALNDIDGGSGGFGTGGQVGLGGSDTGGASGGAVFTDPGCPDVGDAEPNWECDPFSQERACDVGFACQPYLIYSSDDSGCGRPEHGTRCVIAGSASQGESCDERACAAGFMCVVGAKPGARCAQICSLDDPGDCPRGLLCGPTDAQGIGVCN